MFGCRLSRITNQSQHVLQCGGAWLCAKIPGAALLALTRGMAFKIADRPSTSTKRKAISTEGDPRLKIVVSMLQPETAVAPPAESVQDKLAAQHRTEEYLRLKIQRNEALLHDLYVKSRLQKEAIRALPAELREAAQAPDTRPFPPARNFFFDTPPEAYRD